jgi:drug/metabolite transporter (DMT)-like permease
VSGLPAEALGALAALGSAMTWAVTSLLVRTLVPGFHPVAINAIRSAVSGALLLGFIVLAYGGGAFTAISGPTLVLLVVSIVAAIGVGDTFFFDSTRRLGLGRGMSIAMTYPVIAALLAVTLLDEQITPPIALGSLVTLAGLLLIVVSRGRGDAGETDGWWLGVAGATVAAVAWGVSAVLMKAPMREIDPVTAQAVRLPIAAALLFATPWARGAAAQLRASAPATLGRIAVLSVLTAVSSVMYVASLKYAGVTVATVLSATAPLFAIPLGLIFLGERLAAGPLLGALVAVAGIAVLQW